MIQQPVNGTNVHGGTGTQPCRRINLTETGCSMAQHALIKPCGLLVVSAGGSPPPPVITRDGIFVTNTTGAEVHFKAYNWFGFENGKTAPNGLWAGGGQVNTDFQYIVYQMRLLGFNAVRLPFKFRWAGAAWSLSSSWMLPCTVNPLPDQLV